MSKIIKFPRVPVQREVVREVAPPVAVLRNESCQGVRVLRVVWVIVALLWPIAKWIGAIAVTISAMKAVYLGDAIAVGRTIAYLSLLAAMHYFVAYGRPKL